MLSTGPWIASAWKPMTGLGGEGTWLLALPTHHIAGVLVRSAGWRHRSVELDTTRFRPRRLLAELPWRRWAPGRRYASLVAAQLDRL